MARSLKPKAESPLLSALKFVAVAQNKGGTGAGYADYCRIDQKCVTTYNGMLSASHPVDLDLEACPHTDRLVAALSRATGVMSYAYINQSLQLTAGKLKVTVPCVDNRDLSIQHPNPKMLQISVELIDAMERAATFTSTAAERFICASVWLNDGIALGTNGHCLVQAWHGFPIKNIAVPKQFIDVVKTIKLTLIACGYDKNSLTFYYDNGAWIKTQLYNEEWPSTNTNKVLSAFDTAVPVIINPELYVAIEAVSPHAKDETTMVHITQSKVSSDGAEYELVSAGEAVFNANYLIKVKNIIDKIDMFTSSDAMLMTGKATRVMIMKMRL